MSRINRVVRKAHKGSNRLRDRAFATGLHFEPSAPVLVLSPHLDDAVINCWSVLTSAEAVTVLNVFTAAPRSPAPTAWDRVCGASDAQRHSIARAEEDRAALALAGREPANLGFLDAQYRKTSRQPLLREIDVATCAIGPAASAVYAPACLGFGHEDHLLVRRYALSLRAAGVPVVLYADVPYATQYGWPGWVTGSGPDPHLDAEVTWESGLRPLGLDRSAAHVVRLEDGEATRKLAAMRAYATQYAALNQGPIGALDNPRIHGHEVYWRLR